MRVLQIVSGPGPVPNDFIGPFSTQQEAREWARLYVPEGFVFVAHDLVNPFRAAGEAFLTATGQQAPPLPPANPLETASDAL